MLDPSSRRVKIPGNPGMLGLGAVSNTPDMVSCVCVTCARFGASRKVGVPRAWVRSGGEGRGSERLGCGRRECRGSLSHGPGMTRLSCLRRRSPEQGCKPHPLLGQPPLSVSLDLQESDRRRQIADSLQDLFDLTGSCLWHLLPPFSGR